MAQEYKFVPEKGVVRITSDLNTRKESPSTQKADVADVLYAGTTQPYLGYVLDGEAVANNPKWYLTSEGNFFWSGNTDAHTVATAGKILSKPLDHLVCTQRFGERPEFYTALGSPKGHGGMDFRTRDPNNMSDWKRPVYAVLDGTVSEVAENQRDGKFIRLTHDNGYESVYQHLSSTDISKDQKVRAGVKIGITGNSGGACEAPHLHFGYRPIKCNKDNGNMGYVDPAIYFKDEIKYV